MFNNNKLQMDLETAEKGTQPSTFRLQKNLIKMLEVFSQKYGINKTDILTIALYNYLKDDFKNDYEPYVQFKNLNEEMIEYFEKNRK